MTELEYAYGRARTIQEFAREVVLVPEFYRPYQKKPQTLTFRSVRNTLAACTNCHNIEAEERVPSLVKLPFGLPRDTRTHKDWLAALIEQTGMIHNGARAAMPPRDEPRLEPQELDALARWISARAPDDHGRPTISEHERDELTRAFPEERRQAWDTPPAPGFEDSLNFHRCVETLDLLNSLAQIFGVSLKDIEGPCAIVTRKTAARSDAAVWARDWSQCVDRATDKFLNVSKVVSPSTADAILKLYASRNHDYPEDEFNLDFVIKNMTWRGLPQNLREAMLRDLIHFAFQPGVLKADREAAAAASLAGFLSGPSEAKTGLSLSLRRAAKVLLMRNEFIGL